MSDNEFKVQLETDERTIVRCNNDEACFIIIKTAEGYVVDVYDCVENHIDTMTVWDDDLEPDDEDE